MITFYLYFLFLLCTNLTHANLDGLIAKRDALQFEYNLVQDSPATFYLVIDLAAEELYLKADANLLRTCKIIHATEKMPQQTQIVTLQMHIEPYTPIASPRRLLPLDFSGRLTNGPKHRSRLYFTPPLLIQSNEISASNRTPTIQLGNQDIKALASALAIANQAILIPNTTPGIKTP